MVEKKFSKYNATASVGAFQTLGLHESVYRGVHKMGYRTPTPVQRKTLPIAMSGVDLACMARTGSGKTAAFVLPMLERLIANASASANTGSRVGGITGGGTRGLILSPTRELALQTLRVVQQLSCFCTLETATSMVPISSIPIVGGDGMEKQFALLSAQPHIIVATPGRLAHHVNEIADFDLGSVECLVLDEADRLFEMNLLPQVRDILRSCGNSNSGNVNRQTMLFSATMPTSLLEFTKSGLLFVQHSDNGPEVIRLESEVGVSEELRMGFVCVRSEEREAALLHLLRDVIPKPPVISKLMAEEDEEENANDEAAKGVTTEEALEKAETANTSPNTEWVDDKKLYKKNKKKKFQLARKEELAAKAPIVKQLTLIFVATRHHCEYLSHLLNATHDPSLRNTVIYGTMDQSSRQISLSQFRRGITPILIVTDVAARGIDIPYIDYVIHYHFPSSAKLFIHRSGRAARAGRLGWCLGLVDREEMAYLMDLQVFLGLTFLPSRNVEPYHLTDMTPDVIHYGSIPESILTTEMETVSRIVENAGGNSKYADNLEMLQRVCRNAMKQYKKSRSDASRHGVKRAKAVLSGVLEGDAVENAPKPDIHGGGIAILPPHPLCQAAHIASISHLTQHDTLKTQQLLTSLNQRTAMLHSIAAYRPTETIFETLQNRNAPVNGISSGQMDKVGNGKRDALLGTSKQDAHTVQVMKNMRRQMKIVRSKGDCLVVAGSDAALRIAGEFEEVQKDVRDVTRQLTGDDAAQPASDATDRPRNSQTTAIAATKQPTKDIKRPLSKAERKRLKKSGNRTQTTTHTIDDQPAANVKNKHKTAGDYQDASHFINFDPNPETNPNAPSNTKSAQQPMTKQDKKRLQQIEAALQPSATNTHDFSTANQAVRLETQMLDLMGDEKEDLVKKQKLMRWDASKRKYIQTTIGQEVRDGGMSKSKRLKTESGATAVVGKKNKKVTLGELYEKWQKKTQLSVGGRRGVFDEDPNAQAGDSTNTGNTPAKKDDLDTTGGGRFTHRRNKLGALGSNNMGSSKVPNINANPNDPTISASQIQKNRKKDRDTKLKNMKKEDRKKVERNLKARQKEKSGIKELKSAKGTKAFLGKKGKWDGRKKMNK